MRPCGLALLLLFVMPLAALAAELPALTGRVVDDAGLIDPVAETALDQKLEAFEQKSSDQIVVATIPASTARRSSPTQTACSVPGALVRLGKTTASCFSLRATTEKCASRSAMGWKAR